jgi:Superfamily II DNA/RNA helicases, SNF2 family
MDDAAEHLPEYLGTPADPALTPVVTAGRRIGGTHLAEGISPLTPWVHQRIVADTLTAMYPRGFLLCDEVGLGKTIEAGLTVARLIHTGEVDSCLILTPANLMTQWQEELLEKFNLQTHRFERGPPETVFVDGRGSTVEVPDAVADPIWWFTEQRRAAGLPSVIIASWHLMRREDNQELIIHPEAKRDRSMPHRGSGSEVGIWDLVIVDEAHKARRNNPKSNISADTEDVNKLLQLLRRLRETSRAIYLLTATPMAIHSVELYDLLSVVGLPEAWDDPEAFIAFFEQQAAIQQALQDETAGIKGERIGGWDGHLRHACTARQHHGGGPDDDAVRTPADVPDGARIRPVAAGPGLPRGTADRAAVHTEGRAARLR